MDKRAIVTNDATLPLRKLTRARIALGRAGGSVTTREWLDFKGAHAAARDAVNLPFDVPAVQRSIDSLGYPTITCCSAAQDRATFLLRPDLGRQLDDASRETILARTADSESVDLAICVCDGLSTTAIHTAVEPVLARLLPRLAAADWQLGPICIVRNGRVALQDEIGQLCKSTIALTLIGERPGLATACSMGAYVVFDPAPGKTDADRNCISNIHADGLSFQQGAEAIYRLLVAIRSQKISGVLLNAPEGAAQSLPTE